MGDSLRRGVLGGLAGFGSSMADIGKQQAAYRMEELKNKAKYDRQLNLENLRANSARETKQMEIEAADKRAESRFGQEKDLIAARQQSALDLEESQYKRGLERQEEALDKEASMYVSQYAPEDSTPEEVAEAKQKYKTWRTLSALTKDGKLSAEAEGQLIKGANEAWDMLEDREKEKYIAAAGGDSAKARGMYNTKYVKGFKDAIIKGKGMPNLFGDDSNTMGEDVKQQITSRVQDWGSRKKALKELERVQDPVKKQYALEQVDLLFPEKAASYQETEVDPYAEQRLLPTISRGLSGVAERIAPGGGVLSTYDEESL